MGCQKFSEFLQRSFGFPGFRILHGQPVAGECVRRILRENFGKQCDAVHKGSF